MYYACNPPVQLAAFIEKFWLYEGHIFEGQAFAHFKKRSLPRSRLELLINLGADEIRVYDRINHHRVQRFAGSVFRGAHSTFSIIDTAEQSAIMGYILRSVEQHPFCPCQPANCITSMLI